MKLIVLGSGTCVPSLKRNAPGYYLQAGDTEILVDCGSGILLQLERAGKSYKDIDALFITHIHPDHISDLMPLIHALLATPKFKRYKDLFLVGPKGFKSFYEKNIASIMGKPETFSIRVIEIGGESKNSQMDFAPFKVLSAKTIHSEHSIAYRIEQGNKSVVITGDADYDRGIIELSKNADLLIIDCSFPDSMKATGHMSAKECGLVAKNARVKKLLLSHLYPVDTPDADRLEECKEVFDGHVSLAEDLMELIL